MKSAFITLAVACLLVVATGCDDEGGTEAQVPKVRMTIDTSNLAPLSDGFSYKAWAKIGFTYVGTDAFNVTSTGQFTTDAGQLRDKSFVLESDITDAELFLISIEGKSGSGDGPSESIIMAADASGSTNTLTVAHPSAMGADISGQSGQLTVMTPSDEDRNNEMHGVWFVTESGGTLSPGLTLPPLNPGWNYEGWVEVGGAVLSTGTFRSNSGNDSNQFSNPDVPLFPGEDFLLNPPTGLTFPLNLNSANVTITIEPFPDDTIESSGIRVLTGTLPATVTGGSVHQLTGIATGHPTATILIF